MHPQTFFYPLDSLLDWNKAYGRRGFTQYQCVLPHKAGLGVYPQGVPDHRRPRRRAVRRRHQGLRRRRAAARCRSRARASPSASTCRSAEGRTQAIVDAVNDIVAAEGGRVYLTKDAFTRAEHYRAMDPRVDGFNADPPPLGSRRPDSQRAVGAAARRRGVKRIAIVGGTKGIGRAVARQLVARGDRVVLLGRDAGRPGRQRHGPGGARTGGRGTAPATALLDLARAETFDDGAGRRGPAARRVRHRGGHGRRVRHAGRAGGRCRGARARAVDQLHPDNPVLRSGAGAAARRRRRHAVRARVGGRRSGPQAGRAVWRDQGGTGVLHARHRPARIATPGCGRCWSSRGSCGRG